MKRFSTLFIALTLIFTCAIFLTACAGEEKPVEDDVITSESNNDEGPTNEEIEEELNELKTEPGAFVEPELEFSATIYNGNDFVPLADNNTSALKIKDFEPGQILFTYFKLDNTSIMPCSWQLNLIDTGSMSKLAEVIDVYTSEYDVKPIDEFDSELLGFKNLGTLKDFIKLGLPLYEGMLVNGTSSFPCVVFKMQESAGREYQGLELEGVEFQFIANEPGA